MTDVPAPAPDPAGGADHLRLVPVGYGHPDAVRLVAAVQQEYVVRYGGPDETPIDPLMFDPPHGRFLVGYLGEVAVASGAWRRQPVEALGTSAVAEVKRMYVVPGTRRRGLARRVLAALEADAAAHGALALVLETGTAQPEALALYAAEGYEPVAAFGHYRCAPESRYLGKRLGPGAVPAAPSSANR